MIEKEAEEPGLWKSIETRLHEKLACLIHKTVGIHVGKQWDPNVIEASKKYVGSISKLDTIFEMIKDKRIGQIICTANVDATGWLCGDDSKSAMINCMWSARYGLFLKSITKIETPKFSGSQGIWYYDTAKQTKVNVKEFREQEREVEQINLDTEMFHTQTGRI